jgi:tRNA/tmRNA/rRNA uracil-C5-methylase (TrmA/RlmC/RlmD family)
VIISFTQDDGSVEQLSTDDLSALEAAAVEEAMGGAQWQRIESLLQLQDPTALRAVVWAFRRREQSDLKFADFDVPGWRRRLKARISRAEIEDALNNLMLQAISSKAEDTQIDLLTPHLRKLADDPADVDAALDGLGKGHLVKRRPDSAG